MNTSNYNRSFVLLVKTALLGILLSTNTLALAEAVVIVHPSNNANLDENSVRLIFLGKRDEFPNAQKAVPIELAKGDTRASFVKRFIKKSEIELQHYWSVQTFTGKGHPPQKYNSEAEVKKLIAQNPEMIGFIDEANVDTSIKVADIKKSKKRFN